MSEIFKYLTRNKKKLIKSFFNLIVFLISHLILKLFLQMCQNQLDLCDGEKIHLRQWKNLESKNIRKRSTNIFFF